MWCDDFDMDLPKVIPEAMPIIGAIPDSVVLRTIGHETDGKLNHPCCWNHHLGAVAFFTLSEHDRPALPFFVAGFGDHIVRCTFTEAVRDLWAHGLVMVVDGTVVWDAQRIGSRGAFDPLMSHVRGWHPLQADRVEVLKRRVIASLTAATDRMQRLVAERQRLTAIGGR